MQFKISAAAFLAFAASALAQNANFDPVTKPTPNEKINAGTSYTIEWTAPDAFKDVTVSISLIGGATQNTQIPLQDIACKYTNHLAVWDAIEISTILPAVANSR